LSFVHFENAVLAGGEDLDIRSYWLITFVDM
jgi:hypothetical protein